MQRLEPGLQNIGLVRDQLDPGLWDGMGDADRLPVDGGGGSLRAAIAAPAQSGVARIGQSPLGWRTKAPRHGQGHWRKLHIRAQPVHRQAFQQAGREAVRHVDQHLTARVDHQKIHQILALWRQQGSPDDALCLAQRAQVVGHQPLQKAQRIRP